MKRSKRRLKPWRAVCLVFVLPLLPAAAAPPAVPGQAPSPVAREQMGRLDFLLGEWKGKGWMYKLDGSRGMELSQSAKVKRGSDGSTLVVNDSKKYPDFRIDARTPTGVTTLYHPMSMSGTANVYYDEAARLFYWRRKPGGPREKPFEARLVGERTLQVRWEFPGTLLVVTIEVTDGGEWRERQELWMGEKDGWFKLQESVLKKVK